MVPPVCYLAVSAVLFVLGTLGMLLRRDAIVIFMSIELILNSANLAFVTFARQWGNLDGLVFVFFTIAVAAAEAGVGLAIIIAVFRHRRSADVDVSTYLKW